MGKGFVYASNSIIAICYDAIELQGVVFRGVLWHFPKLRTDESISLYERHEALLFAIAGKSFVFKGDTCMASSDVKPRLVPFLDAIKSISICRNTALRHIEVGLMPLPIKLGSKLYFELESWESWIKSGCRPIETGWQPKSRRKA